MRGSDLLAAAPLAAALAALLAAASTGLDARTPLPFGAEAGLYGFFLDRYPLFAVALIYALARLAAAALTPGPASVLRRAVGFALAAALVLAVGLYPTFGGLVLRAGFATGGTAFLNGAPMSAAYALGAAAAALLFGSVLGLGLLAIGRPPRPRRSRGRAVLAAGAGLIARFLALWFALAILGLAREVGLGPWPRRSLDGEDVPLAAALILGALAPHVLLVARRLRVGARPSGIRNRLIRPALSR